MNEQNALESIYLIWERLKSQEKKKMGVASSRVDVISNQTDAMIEIREVREGALPGNYGDIIKLQPREGKEVRASKFTTWSELSGRVSVLETFVNGKQADASLSAPKLIRFLKIVFRRHAGSPNFTISDIRAKDTNLRRIWWIISHVFWYYKPLIL